MKSTISLLVVVVFCAAQSTANHRFTDRSHKSRQLNLNNILPALSGLLGNGANGDNKADINTILGDLINAEDSGVNSLLELIPSLINNPFVMDLINFILEQGGDFQNIILGLFGPDSNILGIFVNIIENFLRTIGLSREETIGLIQPFLSIGVNPGSEPFTLHRSFLSRALSAENANELDSQPITFVWNNRGETGGQITQQVYGTIIDNSRVILTSIMSGKVNEFEDLLSTPIEVRNAGGAGRSSPAPKSALAKIGFRSMSSMMKGLSVDIAEKDLGNATFMAAIQCEIDSMDCTIDCMEMNEKCDYPKCVANLYTCLEKAVNNPPLPEDRSK